MTDAPALRPYGASFGRDHLAEYAKPDTLAVDCHGHMAVPEADALARLHLPAAER
jgi:hypothetical protein